MKALDRGPDGQLTTVGRIERLELFFQLLVVGLIAVGLIGILTSCASPPEDVSVPAPTTGGVPFNWNEYASIVSGTPTPAPVKTAERWEDLMLPPEVK